ncbi:MAG: phosphoribosylglycinamide formyltransferase [Chitinispirillaceae bacterium]|nr:phosphoribosylglycinamide formyltransferase [Chitinispirillaceae bacterium]
MALRCALFASGGGSNFQALLDRQAAGDLHVEFALLIGNNSRAAAFERARSRSIPALHLAPSHFPDEQTYVDRLLAVFRDHAVDLIVLAGYMKRLPPPIVRAYNNRIVNIHPGLLPAFGGPGMYGHHVHEAVLAYGTKVTGVTVHFVDEEYDHGPIILQECVPVLDNDTPDTLAERVLAVEHASYWRAIEAIAQGKIKVEGRRVVGKEPSVTA